MTSTIQSVKNTIAENFGGSLAHSLAPEDSKFTLEDVPDLSGKVAVITGGNEGIGFGCVHTWLSRNIAHVHLVGTSQEVYDGALKSLTDDLGMSVSSRMTFYQCDLADWAKAKATADKIAGATDQIDILMLNSARGIMTYQLSDDGVDRHMAVNHMGNVTLASHLLPTIKKYAKANPGATIRISTMASNAHEMAPKDTRFASLDELNTDLGPNGQYGRSKLANLLYARYLASHFESEGLSNILANSTHPGFVATKMSNEDIHEPYPALGYGMSVLMQPFKKDQFEGALSSLFTTTKTTQSGQYVCVPAIVEPGSEMSRDEALGEQLMELTKRVVSEKTKTKSVDKGCPFKFY